MLATIAVEGYRSLRSLVLPLGRLTVVTGANGTGKSSLYRALRLLSGCALGGAVARAFPGSRLAVHADDGRFEVAFHQDGLLR
ncbi:AAA family ATPase, partial [Cellulosimicrobium funkei]|uniref:AAA family ATPase n=1 Tax=Cellulosimicrobium funkei TaxID=264251 RepID=UPI0030F8C9C5